MPSARLVRLPHANHYVFRLNEADVLREMNAFLVVREMRPSKSRGTSGDLAVFVTHTQP